MTKTVLWIGTYSMESAPYALRAFFSTLLSGAILLLFVTHPLLFLYLPWLRITWSKCILSFGGDYINITVKDSALNMKDNMLHDKTKDYTNIKEYEKINLGKVIILCHIMWNTLPPTGLA